MQKIVPCLWFNNNAVDAALYYKSVFKNVKIGQTAYYSEASAKPSGQKPGAVMTQDFEIEGLKIVGLNGGEFFKLNPAISFFVACSTQAEMKELWQKLSKGGEVRMGLDKYPWSEMYGWTSDQFGVEWQLILATDEKAKIAPCLLFTQDNFGKAEAAIEFYTSLFPDSKVLIVARNPSGKFLDHAAVSLAGQKFTMMDGPGEHQFRFNEAFSFMVMAKDQQEIDQYWEALTEGGEPSQCGWLKDRFGVSWQVVPSEMNTWMSEPAKAERVMAAVLTMKKLDWSVLEKA